MGISCYGIVTKIKTLFCMYISLILALTASGIALIQGIYDNSFLDLFYYIVV